MRWRPGPPRIGEVLPVALEKGLEDLAGPVGAPQPVPHHLPRRAGGGMGWEDAAPRSTSHCKTLVESSVYCLEPLHQKLLRK